MYAIVLILAVADIVNLSYISLFIVGYTLGFQGFTKENTSQRGIVVLSVLAITLQIIRILIRIRYPGFVYYPVYTIVSHTVLGIWIFYIGFAVEKRYSEIVRRVAQNKVVSYFDASSYYVYLVHGLFCMGTAFNVYYHFNNLVISTILFLGLVIAASFILKVISELIASRFL